MVNEKKVRMMTQIALDEMKYHKKEISEGGYYKSDYVRSHILSVLWNITVSYLVLLFLIALYHADYIFVNIASLDYGRLIFLILGIYVGLLVLGTSFSYFYFVKKYVRNKSILREYYAKLNALDEFYQRDTESEREEARDDTITGA